MTTYCICRSIKFTHHYLVINQQGSFMLSMKNVNIDRRRVTYIRVIVAWYCVPCMFIFRIVSIVILDMSFHSWWAWPSTTVSFSTFISRQFATGSCSARPSYRTTCRKPPSASAKLRSMISRWRFRLVGGFLKLKFHWDQFPRNFLADLLATSPTSS